MSDFIGTKLTMNLGERSYDIILKNGALENLYQFARLDRRVAVVTDAGVPAEYAQRVADQCRDAKIITVPQGEASKSMKILESVLRQMLEFNMGRGDLVIAVGGGGIPVIREGSKLSGTPAVIDKDFGSELLAELLDADMLIILTAVEKVAINYNKPDQKGLDDLTPAEAYKYMEENQFAKGSMLPKVQAAVKFAESKAGRTALITLLEKAKDGIEGKTGTRIHQ